MPDPFITVGDLVSYIGRGGTADAGIVLAVEAACDWCRTTAEQAFSRTIGGTVVLDGSGTDALLLPQMPATAAGTVLVDGEVVTDYVLNVDNGMLLRKAAEAPFASLTWPAGRQNIEVTYDHGYDDGDMPLDVKMVALAIAARLVIQGAAIQETVGETAVRYGVNSTDLTNGEKAILRKYRRS